MLDRASRPTCRSDRLPVKGPDVAGMTLGDGTRLVADIWRPDTTDTFPVLLMRQP